MSAVRIAVIGVGHLGKIHARLLRQVAGAELVAVVDPSPDARAAVAAELQMPAYPDHRPIADQIDAAIVATPSRLHHAVAHDLLTHGIHVLVEKPITLNVGDADDLIREAATRRLVLLAGHVERFNPALIAAAPHLAEPKYIDAVRCGAYTCRSTDIGAVLDLMIHDIDIVLSLIEDEVVSVAALGAAVIGPNEDWAQARLTFASGCVANLAASRVAWQPRRLMQVFSRESLLEIDFASAKAKVRGAGGAVQGGQLDVNALTADERTHLKDQLFAEYLPLKELPVSPTNALLEEQRSFVACIRGESGKGASGRDARRALDVAERILSNIAAHRWDGTADGAIGPRFETREGILRGPHWRVGPTVIEQRRLAG